VSRCEADPTSTRHPPRQLARLNLTQRILERSTASLGDTAAFRDTITLNAPIKSFLYTPAFPNSPRLPTSGKSQSIRTGCGPGRGSHTTSSPAIQISLFRLPEFWPPFSPARAPDRNGRDHQDSFPPPPTPPLPPGRRGAGEGGRGRGLQAGCGPGAKCLKTGRNSCRSRRSLTAGRKESPSRLRLSLDRFPCPGASDLLPRSLHTRAMLGPEEHRARSPRALENRRLIAARARRSHSRAGLKDEDWVSPTHWQIKASL
jgi:hypothetical protein